LRHEPVCPRVAAVALDLPVGRNYIRDADSSVTTPHGHWLIGRDHVNWKFIVRIIRRRSNLSNLTRDLICSMIHASESLIRFAGSLRRPKSDARLLCRYDDQRESAIALSRAI